MDIFDTPSRYRGWGFLLILALCFTGCEDPAEGPEVDAGADVAQDVTDVDDDDRDELDGPLRRPVDVYYDEQGMPHVYAETLEDLFFVNGYVEARDRFGQMEFYRRISTGTLSEILGGFSDDPIAVDTMFRMIGIHRAAREYWDANYDPEKESHIILESYAAGVNAFLQAWRDGEEEVHPALETLFPPEAVRDWEPADSMTIARLLAVQMTYLAPVFIELTELRQRVLDTFYADSDDPDMAARAGIFNDVLRFAPATDTTHIDGFPSALMRDDEAPRVDPELLENARKLHRGLTEVTGVHGAFDVFQVDSPLRRGSNNWVVSGDHTESGFPHVANDPHIDLALPSVFYPIKLVLEDDLDGREDLWTMGVTYMGAPGVFVGRNRDMAWGTTVTFYDFVDIYQEEITGSSDDDQPPTVRFNDEDVAIERVVEPIHVGQFGNISETIEYTVEIVPHHGPLIPPTEDERPVTRHESEALSVRWVGMEASDDFEFGMKLWRAETADDIADALQYWKVGPSNFVFGFANGDIYYSGRVDLPVRSEGALTFDPVTNVEGTSPAFILPGDGSAEWEGFLADEHIPHALNPEKGYIITANNDPVGATLDNNPFAAEHYLGPFYAGGFRAARIEERIEEHLASGEPMTVDDQIALQDDPYDGVAARFVPHLVEAVDTVLDTEIADDTAPDLQALRAEIEGREEDLQMMRDLLDGWDFLAPGTRTPTGSDIERSSAATLFNVTLVYALKNAFADEMSRLDYYEDGSWSLPVASQLLPRAMLFLLENAEEAISYDEEVGDSLFFDDLNTEDVTETRLTVLVRALLQARDRLAGDEDFGSRFNRDIPGPASADPDDWIWGNLHGLALDGFFPIIEASFRRPESELPFYERPGGTYSISPCGNGYRNFNFTCTSGASIRMVHDIDPDDTVTYNVLPGGASENPESPHFDDQIERWNRNDPYLLIRDRDAVSEAALRHEVFDGQ